MKLLFTSCFFLAATVMYAADVNLPSTPYVWDPSSGLVVDNGDKIIVKNNENLTIDYASALNVSLEIQAGGICTIKDISNQSGENIVVQAGGTLNFDPQAGTDITIGQNVTIEGLEIPALFNDATFAALTTNTTPTIAKVNILDNGNYPKITFAGDLTIEAGGVLDIKYPADQTMDQLRFNNLNFESAVVHTAFIPFLKLLITTQYPEYAAQAHKLDPGVIPPVILYVDDSKRPDVTGGIRLDLEVLSTEVDLLLYRPTASFQGFPENGSYVSHTIDMSINSAKVPDTFTGKVPMTVIVPEAGTYSATIPKLTSGTNNWYMRSESDNNVDVDMGDENPLNRKHEIVFASHGTNSDLYFESSPRTPTDIKNTGVGANVVSKQYYSLSGAMVANPTDGIYVVKYIYDNGETKTLREMIIK